jgi:hypothetical protein
MSHRGALVVLPDYPVFWTGNNRQFAKLLAGKKRQENHARIIGVGRPGVVVIGGAGYRLVHMH